MTTKAPSSVVPFPPDSLEKIAYESVSEIPTQEPNDQYRLGYNVWMWLVDRKGTLLQTIRSSGSRMHVSVDQAHSIISQHLKSKGIEL